GVPVAVLAAEALDGGDEVGADPLRGEVGVVVGGGVQGPCAPVGALRHARHGLAAAGEDDLVPAGTDLLGGYVDGGEAGSTEAVDLDAGDGVRHPCGEGGDAREIHPLVAERGDDPVDDVRDPVLVEKIGRAHV